MVRKITHDKKTKNKKAQKRLRVHKVRVIHSEDTTSNDIKTQNSNSLSTKIFVVKFIDETLDVSFNCSST